MNFYFTDKISDVQITSFVNKNKKAYKHIQSMFNCVLPKKIDIYVFNTECDNLGNTLSYANPALCTIHTKLEHTYGHELAHVIYWYLHPNIIKTRFIDEGIATYFDRENYFKVCDIDSFDFGQHRKINIKDVWLNFEKYDNIFSYNIAGFFIAFLIENYSMDLLKKFLKEQTLEHAEIVFGVSFKSKLKSFEQMINKSLKGRLRNER